MDTIDVPTRSESSGSSEGRVHKFQKTGSNGSRLRKTSAAHALPATRPPAGDTKSPLRGRAKVPLGPRERPHDFSKQRIASGITAASIEGRSLLPTSTQDATTTSTTTATTTTRTANPRFTFAPQPAASPKEPAGESSGAYDFLPLVNFDEFANSIAYEPALSDFPVPATFKSATSTTPTMTPFTGLPTEPRSARSNPFMQRFTQSAPRQPGTASTAAGSTTPADASSTPPPATNMTIRTRRQSHFPAHPLPPNPAARVPRKSIGPGVMPATSFDRSHEMPKLNGDNTQARAGPTPSVNAGNRRETISANPNPTTGPNFSSATRSTKAKSFHPPAKQGSGHLAASSMTPDPGSMPYNHARSPGKSPAQRNPTPSSSSKRQSTLPHLSGLGARTISPTDARRLRRMSVSRNSKPPGGPVGPPTPQGDFPPEDRSFSQSPAIAFPNSVTPSSACATPEQNRKSYASGISQSSNSSLNSQKVGGSNIPLRANPTLSGSRLPTPKQRNVHSSAAGEDEDVPPVPAIPKAYESPKDPERSSFAFTTPSKMSMPPLPLQEPAAYPDSYATGNQNTASSGPQPANANISQKSMDSIRHRRGLTVGTGPEPDRTPTVQSSKKNLQPIRLPPLNLLPLGTPCNNRISSFPVPSAEIDDSNVTPPPKRAINKTPSTPMTASKASFFSKSNTKDQYEYGKHLRSSSSAINLRTPQPSLNDTTTVESMPVPILHSGRQATTPFASDSLPKGGGDSVGLNSRPSGEHKLSDNDVELQNIKVAGPRPLLKKDTSDSAHTSTSTEPETPSSGGSSLRRKLSLGGWRRGMSSKSASQPTHNSHTRKDPQKSDELPPQPPKHADMAPPRLLTSSTWSGSVGTSPTATPTSATTRVRPSLDFGRRKTSTATLASETDVEKPSPRKGTGPRAPSSNNEQPRSVPATKSSSSLLTPMQRILGSKSSSSMLKARNLDSNLDKEEAMADEEMKRLASKRKDFEHAARDVDELRKRAKPQERVSPTQALQMVSLNIFERGEIIDYKEVYFCGTKGAKKHIGDLNAQTANFGYDDDRGDYNIVFGDHLAYRYEVVNLLGKGSFGQVVRCVDHKTGGLVAIKIIRNKKRFHQQALVEVNILQKLREWDPDNKHSMINFTQSFYFRGHLCISTELLDMNLYEFIKAHEFKGFSLRIIRRFCKQMLGSLVLLKGHRVIHCDLKPENILLAHPLHSEIKVIDFGSSCFENEKVYTYIQSRFYRSPEVILGMSYGLPIDMWSLGCILAELLTGYPIFPGENEQEQLACIMEIFGPPEKHLIEKSSRKKLFFDSLGKPRVTVSTKGRRRRPSSKTLQQALKCDDEAYLDFISRCLRWDPERRLKPDEAMQHEFITGVRKSTRQRQPVNANVPSPVKRIPSSQTVQAQTRVRPLPEPPATSFKNNAAVSSSRDQVPSNSPIKATAPSRRHSTIQGQPGITGVKRAANGAPLNAASSLPRVTQRSVSGKPDLASAAAIASLKGR